MQFIQDLRVAARSLLRVARVHRGQRPGVLGLGLAVVVTMFGVMHTIAEYAPASAGSPRPLVGIQLIDRVHNPIDVVCRIARARGLARRRRSKFEDLGRPICRHRDRERRRPAGAL